MTSPLAVVTGASSGIGAAFSRQLSRQGFRVLAVARRLDRLQAVEAETGGRIVGLQQDLRAADAAEPGRVNRVMTTTMAQLPGSATWKIIAAAFRPRR